jgi:hypothetical protein
MFAIKSVGHFFARLVHDVRVGEAAVVSHEAQIRKVAAEAGEAAVAVISVVDPVLAPLASSIERAGEDLLGEALAATSKVDAAVKAPLTITLDVEAAEELKQLLADIKAAKGAAAVTAPANLK